MCILDKATLQQILLEYYLESYGAQNTDIPCESVAANVRTFKRDGRYVSLKCDIRTGKVEVFEE